MLQLRGRLAEGFSLFCLWHSDFSRLCRILRVYFCLVLHPFFTERFDRAIGLYCISFEYSFVRMQVGSVSSNFIGGCRCSCSMRAFVVSRTYSYIAEVATCCCTGYSVCAGVYIISMCICAWMKAPTNIIYLLQADDISRSAFLQRLSRMNDDARMKLLFFKFT